MQLNRHVNQGSLLYFDQLNERLSVSQNEHFRWLAFDNVIQSIMSRRQPEKLTLPHHVFLMLPLLFFKPNNVLEFGLGGGNLARFILSLNSEINFTSIERSSAVVNAFEKYFNPENIDIKIISDEEISLRKKLQKMANQWLIYDIYRDNDDHHSYQQLIKITQQLKKSSCLSINLVNVCEHTINQLLVDLQNHSSHHQLSYFNVPHYQNMIVHLLPTSFAATPMSAAISTPIKDNTYDSSTIENSYLATRLYRKWLSFWQHGRHNPLY